MTLTLTIEAGGQRRVFTLDLAGNAPKLVDATPGEVYGSRMQPTATGETVEAALTRYRSARSLQGVKPRTLREDDLTLQRVARECGWLTMADVEPRGLRRYLERLREAGRTHKWLRNTLSTVAVWGAWAVSEGLLHASPADSIKLGKAREAARRRMRPFTPAEVEALVAEARRDEASARPRVRVHRSTIYLVMFATGGRHSEVSGSRAIRWRHVTLDGDAAIDFDASVAKAEAGRVPLMGPALDALRAWHRACAAIGQADPDDLVFPVQPVHRVLHADMREAGVVKRCPTTGRGSGFHSFRHGFATHLAASGVAPAVAQRLLRHRDVGLTMSVYTQLSEQHLRDALQSCGQNSESESDRQNKGFAKNLRAETAVTVDRTRTSRQTHGVVSTSSNTQRTPDPGSTSAVLTTSHAAVDLGSDARLSEQCRLSPGSVKWSQQDLNLLRHQDADLVRELIRTANTLAGLATALLGSPKEAPDDSGESGS